MEPWYGWGYFFSSRSLLCTLLETSPNYDRIRRNLVGMGDEGEAGNQFS